MFLVEAEAHKLYTEFKLRYEYFCLGFSVLFAGNDYTFEHVRNAVSIKSIFFLCCQVFVLMMDDAIR